MRIILFILLFVPQLSFAQFGNKNLSFRSPITTPAEGFNWNNLQSQSPTTYTSQSNLVIDGKSFTNLNCGSQSGNNLVLNGCTNITIRNSYFGSSCGFGIAITGSTNVLIENCFFANNKSGVYADGGSQDIIIQDNYCINPCGPFSSGQFVQFNTVTTSASGQCAVRRNRVQSYRGESYPEDIINMFSSSGRAGAPIDISDNILVGGGPSASGGGILAGDFDGSYATLYNNWIINPGNYGIAVAGGHNYILNSNRVYSVSYPWNNIGAYVWAQGGATCSNVTFTDNMITYLNASGAANNFWDGGNCGAITISNNVYNQPFAAMFPEFPDTLIDIVTEDILWQIRDESQQFRVSGWLVRPTSNAGADQDITSSTATLSGAASTSTDGKNYRWVQVSGPNTATMSAPLAVTNNLSGLVTGTYRFRLEVTDNSGAGDADWVDITTESILYFEDVEGADPFGSYVSQQIETAYGLTASTEQSYNGTKSGRFELRDTDPMNNNGTRAEISFPDATNLERWYSYAVYFPSAEYLYDSDDEVISQWHQGGGFSPAISLRTRQDKYRLTVKETPTTTEQIELDFLIKDQWNTIVFHIIHSSDTDGLIEMWLNGVKVVDRTGINMYVGLDNPNWKMGIYKSGWNDSDITDTNLRVLYFDDIRLGNESATYEEMAPSQQ